MLQITIKLNLLTIRPKENVHHHQCHIEYNMLKYMFENIINLHHLRMNYIVSKLIAVGESTHTTRNAEHIVVGSINTDLGCLSAFDAGIRKDKLESSIVNPREIATSAWLVFFRAKCERVDIDTRVWRTSVVLEWLN